MLMQNAKNDVTFWNEERKWKDKQKMPKELLNKNTG